LVSRSNGSFGTLGGAHVGYYFQMADSFVLGMVAEFDRSNFGNSIAVSGGEVAGAGGALTIHNNWQAFLMGRAGYAVDRVLFYGAAGLAVANVEGNLSILDPNRSLLPYSASQTKTLVGWAVGVGVDYAFDPHWIVNGEVRYVDFGKASYSLPYNLAQSGRATTYNASIRETLGLLGLSYRF
jgi:outer membrane immunogenic protein